MAGKNDGGSAFPSLKYLINADAPCEQLQVLGQTLGMSLRDLFALGALVGLHATGQGILAVSQLAEKLGKPPMDVLVKGAYDCADAMLKERERD